jgi:2-dehydro-3-deoxyphosphogluconate aldolase/(4S)-4-hydroxy-2-oxoglutarate aldolase
MADNFDKGIEGFNFHLAHVGINSADEAEAVKTADEFQALFGFVPKAGSTSVFAGPGIEVMKSKGLGARGHIAIGTPDVVKAREFLQTKGYTFAGGTEKFDKDDNLMAVYLEQEIGGFALHLVRHTA